MKQIKKIINYPKYRPLERKREGMTVCYCEQPRPTGMWLANTAKSYAQCECKGWYETDPFKGNLSNGKKLKTIIIDDKA